MALSTSAPPDLSAGLAAALERTGGLELLAALEDVSPSDRAHSERVGEMTMQVVAATGCQPETAIRAGFAGSLHDVGKADPSVQELITGSGPLSAVDKVRINHRHTTYGALLVSAMGLEGEDRALVLEAVNAARYHHHFPGALLKIPTVTPITRMIQVADRFDAMQDRSRPYHQGKAWTADQAASIIEEDFTEEQAWDRTTRATLGWLYAHNENWHS